MTATDDATRSKAIGAGIGIGVSIGAGWGIVMAQLMDGDISTGLTIGVEWSRNSPIEPYSSV